MDRTADRPALDRNGVEVLTTDECLRLLATEQVGRVAFVDGDPVVLPVNFVLDGWTIAFRTTFGSKFLAAALEQPVAFEVDHIEPGTRSGWSVLVKGIPEAVHSHEIIARLDALGLEPWATGVDRPHWVRVHPEEITGRRVGPTAVP